MASIQVLRRRIRSIQGTTKIVRAMEMVATAKMRRTQQQALAGRPYTEKIRQVIADIAIEPGIAGKILPLLRETRSEKNCHHPHRYRPRIMWWIEYEPESSCGGVYSGTKDSRDRHYGRS